jgi:hypothetical protein
MVSLKIHLGQLETNIKNEISSSKTQKGVEDPVN